MNQAEAELDRVSRELEAEGYWGAEYPQGGYYELLTRSGEELVPVCGRDGKPVQVTALTDVFTEIKRVFHRLRPELSTDGAAWDGFNMTFRWVPAGKKKRKS